MITWAAFSLVFIVFLLPAMWATYLRLRGPQTPHAARHATWPEMLQSSERSAELLKDVLDECEYAQLRESGYLDIASPGYDERVYRVPQQGGRVCVYERGTPMYELCLQPIVPLPLNDLVVLHKLMIQANELEYLACANQLPLTLPRQYYQLNVWAPLL